MKYWLKLILVTLVFFHSTAFALNPINGWYAGLILGGSYAPGTDLVFRQPVNSTAVSCQSICSTSAAGSAACCQPGFSAGHLKYSGFGNIGGQIGIRRNHYRLEIEPIVNYNPYQKITVGTTTYTSPKQSAGIRFEGATTTGLLMVNGFYDFYSAESESAFAPYLGAGLGYAYVNNSLKFYCNNNEIACTHVKDNQSSTALQGIIGASYFMDSFTWFSLDYRYITTNNIDMLNSRAPVHTINLSFNGMFNCD